MSEQQKKATEDQIFKGAQILVLAGKDRKTVLEFMAEQGITGEKAEAMATEAFESMKDEQKIFNTASNNGGGNQVFQMAQKMFLADKGRKEVLDFLETQGVTGEEAEKMATDAFKSIRDQRRAIIEQQGGTSAASESKGSAGIGSILFGLVLIIGGIVATMSSDSIWYGAILVGVITLIQGIAQRA